MQWFLDVKIGTKLLAGFVVVALIAAGIGYIGVSSLKTADDSDTMLYEQNTVPAVLMGKVSTNFQQVRVNTRDILLAQTPEEVNADAQSIITEREEITKLLAQVEKADEYRAMRIRNHGIYRRELGGVPGIVFQKDETDALCVHWMNTLKLEPRAFGVGRDELVSHLKSKGVETRLLFTGMHRQKALIDFGCDWRGDFYVTDDLTANGLYLPSASDLSEEDIVYVCDAIKKVKSS